MGIKENAGFFDADSNPSKMFNKPICQNLADLGSSPWDGGLQYNVFQVWMQPLFRIFWRSCSIGVDVEVFRDGILERHFKSRFLGINSNFLQFEFSILIFPFNKMVFMKRLEFYSFADFCKVFQSQRRVWFSVKIRQQKGLGIAWRKRFWSFVNLMSKNSISGKEELYPE